MASEKKAYLFISKINDDVTNTFEKKIINYFDGILAESIEGIEIKKKSPFYLIKGESLPRERKGNLFRSFWIEVRGASSNPKFGDDINLFIDWFENLSVGKKATLTDSFESFFNFLGKKHHLIYVLIHFGGGGSKDEIYSKHLNAFFNKCLPDRKIEFIPISGTKAEQNITFSELIGSDQSLTTPYLEGQVEKTIGSLEGQLEKTIGKRAALFKAFDEIYLEATTAGGFDILWHEKVIPRVATPIVSNKQSFNEFEYTFLELSLNGVLVRKPNFLDNLLHSKQGANKVNIVYLNPDSFTKNVDSGYKALHDKNLKEVEDLFKTTPTLFLGYFDFQNKEHQEEIEFWWDDRFRFFDSCIWFRYASLSDPDQLEQALSDIKDYLDDKIYDLNTSKEFLEFQTRLFNNSYIKRISRSGHHSGNVTPFSFHSELNMKINADEKLRELNGYAWNILVADDHCKGNTQQPGVLNKTEIIKKVLKVNSDLSVGNKDIVEIRQENAKVTLNLHYATTIEDALNMIEDKPYYYDIVLLDYLFENNDKFEYGDKLIIKLAEKIKEMSWNKIWIMPISVYHNALIDNLRNALIPLYHKYLIISEGADPICTPELFRYRLFSFLALQKEELIKSQTGNESFKEILKGIDVIELNQASVSIEEWSSDAFVKIVELGTTFKTMTINRDKKSAFAISALENDFFNLKKEEDWYHIQNLFYLIAFGNEYQYPQIRKELLYVYKTLFDKNPLFQKLNELVVKKFK